MYNHAPQSENIEAKCAVVYSIESVLCGRNFVKVQTPTRQFDTNSSTTNSLDKLSFTNAPVIALGHEQRRSYVSDMFAGCAIGCCSLRQARENAFVSGTFFALLQIARRELYLANHKT